MKIRVQSIKFNADVKLLDFIDKKLQKLDKFFDGIIDVDVTLSLEPDHTKVIKVIVNIPGDNVIMERKAGTFEDATNTCADLLKDQLVKVKEKRFGK
ncbi:MAG: ribosome-associated translation inhibitor RaiA [Bacteroidales bacterium]